MAIAHSKARARGFDVPEPNPEQDEEDIFEFFPTITEMLDDLLGKRRKRVKRLPPEERAAEEDFLDMIAKALLELE